MSTDTPENLPRFFIDHGMIHDRITGRHVHGNREIEPGVADEAIFTLNQLHASALREIQRFSANRTCVPAQGKLIEELLDAAFRQLQHDTGPQDKEYVFQRGVLQTAFRVILRKAAPEPAGERVGVVPHKPLTYLAAPYSHPDREVRVRRFEQINAVAADLMRSGLLVYSPISHTHPIAEAGDLPLGWDFWQAYDRAFIEHSNKVIVLRLDGWQQSKGVTAEIAIANQLGTAIEYIDQPTAEPAQGEMCGCALGTCVRYVTGAMAPNTYCRAAGQPLTEKKGSANRSYWMIERGSPCEWWVGNLKIPNEDGGEWTTDSSKAQHFSEEWFAKLHAAELESWGIPGPLRATGHLDMKGPLPAKNGYCGCRREEQCGYIWTERIVRDGKCRIAAGQPFVEESAGQAPKVARPGERPIDSTPDLADPAAVEAEIARHARHYANCAIGEKGAALERTFDNCIRAWLDKYGTRNDGLRDAAEAEVSNEMRNIGGRTLREKIVLLNSGRSYETIAVMVYDAMQAQAIAALSSK